MLRPTRSLKWRWSFGKIRLTSVVLCGDYTLYLKAEMQVEFVFE